VSADLAYSTRRFTFAAAHRYSVEEWSLEENERVFGRPRGRNVCCKSNAFTV